MTPGYSHQQRQGTGLATILTGGDKSANLYIMGAQRDADARAKEKARKEKEALAAMDEIKNFNPDFFYIHESEKKEALDALASQGSQMLAAGTNPFTDPGESGRAFRKEYSRIQQLSEVSTQMREDWKSMAHKIAANPNKYTPESIVEWNKYYNTSASETMKDGKLPPTLTEQTPIVNRVDLFNQQSKIWSDQFPDQEIDDKTLEGLSQQMLEDGSLGPQLKESYDSTLSLIGPERKRAIQERADNSGRNIYSQMAFEDAQMAKRNKTPFLGTAFIEAGLSLINPSTIKGSGPSGGSTRIDMKGLREQTDNIAANLVAEDPRALKFYDKPTLLPREGDNDIEYSERLTKYVSDLLFDQTEKNRESFLTQSGKDDKVMNDSGDLWLKHVMSPDARLNREATSHLRFLKGQIGKMTVTEVEMQEEMKDGKPHRFIEMTLDGPPKMVKPNAGGAGLLEQLNTDTTPEDKDEQIKSTLEDAGLNPEQFGYRQIGTKRVIRVPIDVNRESALLSLYRMKFRQDKSPYTGANTVITPKLSTLSTGGSPQGAKWTPPK